MKYKTLRHLFEQFYCIPELTVKHLTNEKYCKKIINDLRYDIKDQISELKNSDYYLKIYGDNYIIETKELIRDLLEDKNEVAKYYNSKHKRK